MNPSIRSLSFVWILVLILAPLLVSAEEQAAGSIVFMSEESDCYRVTRGDNSGSAKLLMQLHAGDRITCKCKRDGDITIELAGDQKRLSCKKDIKDGYPIPEPKGRGFRTQALSVAQWVFEETIGWLTDLHDQRAGVPLAQLTVRDLAKRRPRLVMPLIAPSGAQVQSGRRDLHLVWWGGRPPYKARIRDAGSGRTIAERTGLREGRVTFARLALQSGTYHVQVSDAGGQTLERRLRAVEPSELPPLPREGSGRHAAPPRTASAQTIYAAWLVRKSRSRWALEAYQRVYDIAPSFYPAELLKLKLEGSL